MSLIKKKLPHMVDENVDFVGHLFSSLHTIAETITFSFNMQNYLPVAFEVESVKIEE